MKYKPNYVDIHDPNEVTLHARDIGKTGSKHLRRFSSKRGYFRTGQEFLFYGRSYIIEKITDDTQ